MKKSHVLGAVCAFLFAGTSTYPKAKLVNIEFNDLAAGIPMSSGFFRQIGDRSIPVQTLISPERGVPEYRIIASPEKNTYCRIVRRNSSAGLLPCARRSMPVSCLVFDLRSLRVSLFGQEITRICQ